MKASITPEAMKTKWIITIQNNCCSLPGVICAGSRAMKFLSKLMPEMATIEAISFNFRPAKSTLPIHSGRSSWSPTFILETKFS